MNQKLTNVRLQKEQASIQRQPIPNAIVTRDGHLNFHFCLYNLQGQYKDGLYHGHLQLHQNYPFNAPKLYFYTPSGRFETNLPICTSFTNYHQETWTTAWNVRSLILATISFMYSEEPSYGCRTDSESVRKEYAQKSKQYNFTHIPNFAKFFGKKLVDIKQITEEQLINYTKQEKQVKPEQNQRQQQQKLEPLFQQIEINNQEQQELNQNNQQIEFLIDHQPDQHLYVQEFNRPKPKQNKNPPKKIKNKFVTGLVLTIGVVAVIYLYKRFK